MSYIDWRKVHIESTDEEGQWITKEDLYFPLDDCSGKAILIKAGFSTDLASTPKAIWNIYDPADIQYRNSAILHDGLYRAQMFPRDICDDWMYEAMDRQGNGWFTKHIFYVNLRMFGGSAYDGNTVESIARAREFVSIIPIEKV